MLMQEKLEPQKTLSVCATCPWRKKLQGTKHPAGWYKLANIKRLWNGIRTGNAPGMVCHASDPGSVDYGSTKVVPEGTEKRECAGALQLIFTEINILNGHPTIKAYGKTRKSPMTRAGVLYWMERYIFGKPPAVMPCEDVGFPWKQDLEVQSSSDESGNQSTSA
jgi:hypothetical protein